MAVLVTHENSFGQTAPHYWRLNSFDQLPNRQPDGSFSTPAIARFRSFISEEAFKAGRSFVDERLVIFTPAAISTDMAAAAYAAFTAAEPPAELPAAVSKLAEQKAALGSAADKAEAALEDLIETLGPERAKTASSVQEAVKEADRIAHLLRETESAHADAELALAPHLEWQEAVKAAEPA